MAKPGKMFLRFLVMIWSRIRGVPQAQRFTALFAVLVTASALRRSTNQWKPVESQLPIPRRRRRKSTQLVGVPLVSSKTPDASTMHNTIHNIQHPSSSSPNDPSAAANIANIINIANIATTPTVSFLDGLSGVGTYLESLYQALVNRVVDVRQQTGNTVVGALSATKLLFENTKHNVQTRAADLVTKTALQKIEPMLETISLQVKRRIKDKDMPVFVLRMIDETVDAILPDIKEEFRRRTLEVRDTYLSPALTIKKRRKSSQRKRTSRSNRRQSTHRIQFSYDEDPSLNGRGTPLEQLSLVPRHLSYCEEGKEGKEGKEDNQSQKGYNNRSPSLSVVRWMHQCHRASQTRWKRCRQNVVATCRRHGHGIRSFVLYTMHPYNRTIWSQVRNWKWIAMTSLGLVPVVGQLFWLFVFLIKNKRDEYQVIDFIVGFQCARFLAQGLFHFIYGCGLYYKCVNFNGDCATQGPSLSVWGACYFMVQIIVVWSAFLMLPFTSRPSMTPEVRQAHAHGRVICVDRPNLRGNGCLGGGAPRRSTALSPSPPPVRRRSSLSVARPAVARTAVARPSVARRLGNTTTPRSTSVASNSDDHIIYIYDDDGQLVKDMTVDGRAWSDRIRLETQRGGHLIKLFWYGTLTTVLAGVGVGVALYTMHGWRLRGTLFWIRTLYCLLLCPFVIFKVPMMMRLLTQARQTGYDTQGRTCVQHKKIKFDRRGERPRDTRESTPNGSGAGRLGLLKRSLGLKTRLATVPSPTGPRTPIRRPSTAQLSS